jgi:hypothetical protein
VQTVYEHEILLEKANSQRIQLIPKQQQQQTTITTTTKEKTNQQDETNPAMQNSWAPKRSNARLGPSFRALCLAHDREGQADARLNAARAQAEAGEEKSPSDSSVIAALGDKAYQGHPYVYVPHKRYKGKRMTQRMKEYNRSLSSTRVIVENVNKRLEDFKVIGSVYRGVRDAGFVTQIVRVVVSLYNLKQEAEPLRRFPKH